jgi:integrase
MPYNTKSSTDLTKTKSENLHNQLQHGLKLENMSKSESTRKRYLSAWKLFTNYCDHYEFRALPAQFEVIYAFLSYLHDSSQSENIDLSTSDIEQYSLNSIMVAKAAIEHFHKTNNFVAPTNHHRIKQLIEGIRRDKSAKTKSSSPICYQDLMTIIDFIDTETLVGLRDKSIMLLAFCGGFRPSEIISLNISDFIIEEQGMKITIQKSKTDQINKGHTLAIPFNADTTYCPIRTLQLWLSRSQISSGAIYRGFYKGYKKIRTTNLTYQAFYNLVKERLNNADFSSSLYSPHGFRGGFNTDAAASGASLFKMREITKQSLQTQQRYIKEVSLFEDNAVESIFSK